MFINNNLNKGISTPIAILVIMTAAVIGGGLVLWQYSEMEKETGNVSYSEIQFPKSSPAASTESAESAEDIVSFPDTEIDISDWETYRNEEHEFEIKYPDNWYVRKAHGLEAILFLDADETKVIPIGGVGITPDYYLTDKEENQEPVEWIGFEIICYAKSSNFTWDKWVKNNFPERKGYKDYILDNLNAVTLIGPNGIVRGCPSIFVASDRSIYRATLFCNASDKEEESLKIFDQMLSTFQFIE